jgi:hypothetical protein
MHGRQFTRPQAKLLRQRQANQQACGGARAANRQHDVPWRRHLACGDLFAQLKCRTYVPQRAQRNRAAGRDEIVAARARQRPPVQRKRGKRAQQLYTGALAQARAQVFGGRGRGALREQDDAGFEAEAIAVDDRGQGLVAAVGAERPHALDAARLSLGVQGFQRAHLVAAVEGRADVLTFQPHVQRGQVLHRRGILPQAHPGNVNFRVSRKNKVHG